MRNYLVNAAGKVIDREKVIPRLLVEMDGPPFPIRLVPVRGPFGTGVVVEGGARLEAAGWLVTP